MLGDLCEPEEVGAAEVGSTPDLWKALVEEFGHGHRGPGRVGRRLGRHPARRRRHRQGGGRYAAPVPLAELSLVGGWVCEQAGLALPDGPVAVVIGDGRRTYWAPVAASFVVVTDAGVAVVGTDGVTWAPRGVNYAGEPWADVTVADGTSFVAGPTPAQVRAPRLQRSLLMAGALGQAVELSVQYCNGREQFGQAIGKFQVLQQYLAQMAGEAATAEAAADNAVDVVAGGASDAEAVARDRGRQDGDRSGRRHHRPARPRVHGAIGYTDEHRLQYTTRRLWAWRDEHGAERSGRRRSAGRWPPPVARRCGRRRSPPWPPAAMRQRPGSTGVGPGFARARHVVRPWERHPQAGPQRWTGGTRLCRLPTDRRWSCLPRRLHR
ncbi:MAG: acyl-CoA dehydrogenase family protein [Acidimicrobiales bacterium]